MHYIFRDIFTIFKKYFVDNNFPHGRDDLLTLISILLVVDGSGFLL